MSVPVAPETLLRSTADDDPRIPTHPGTDSDLEAAKPPNTGQEAPAPPPSTGVVDDLTQNKASDTSGQKFQHSRSLPVKLGEAPGASGGGAAGGGTRLQARRLALLITDREVVDLELKRVLASEKKQPIYSKFQDKVTFLLATVFCFAVCFLLGRRDGLVLWIYTALLLALVPARFVLYRRLKYEYFLLDFCYFGNFILAWYLWIAPDTPELFTIAFAISVGPLSGAVLLFRNSLVFHSFDKMTSCFIHLAPLLVCFHLRHASSCFETSLPLHGETTLSAAGKTSKVLKCSTPLLFSDPSSTVYEFTLPATYSLLDAVFLPLVFYFAHLILYVGLINLPAPIGLPEDPAYLTSYRYLTTKSKTAERQWDELPGGKKMRPLWYLVINFASTCGWYLPAPLWYWSREGMACWVALFVGLAVWNGGGFYIEVFGRRGKK